MSQKGRTSVSRRIRECVRRWVGGQGSRGEDDSTPIDINPSVSEASSGKSAVAYLIVFRGESVFLPQQHCLVVFD